MLSLANIGVPMLLVVGPVLLYALLPIVLIESWVYRWRTRTGWGRAVLGSLGANVLSTVVGVPLTWLALVGLQLATGGGREAGVGLHAVTWQAPWLIPYESELHWMVPAAALVLCVPFFLVSVLIEGLFLRWIWKDLGRENVRRACWIGNGLTYGCLIAFWGLQLSSAFLPRPSA